MKFHNIGQNGTNLGFDHKNCLTKTLVISYAEYEFLVLFPHCVYTSSRVL